MFCFSNDLYYTIAEIKESQENSRRNLELSSLNTDELQKMIKLVPNLTYRSK